MSNLPPGAVGKRCEPGSYDGASAGAGARGGLDPGSNRGRGSGRGVGRDLRELEHLAGEDEVGVLWPEEA